MKKRVFRGYRQNGLEFFAFQEGGIAGNPFMQITIFKKRIGFLNEKKVKVTIEQLPEGRGRR